MAVALEEDEELWRSPGWLYPSILVASAAVLVYRSRLLSTNKDNKDVKPFVSAFFPPASFLSSQRRFLGVFFLAVAAEDLHSIYGESFLAHKGFQRDRIAWYLAFSHSTSLLVGPLMGLLADHFGRKKACVLYCLLQLICSLTKQSANNVILWSASITNGLARSLLSSAFESWFVAEHEKSGFRQEWISDTFWLISFGASVIAIGAGGLANYLVARQSLGLAAPSLAAAVVAGLTAFGVLFWEENPLPSYAKLLGSLKNDLIFCSERKIILLGCAHACLDFASTVFWFLWTPTLVADGRGLHNGLLFPCLMACEMLGSTISAMVLCGPWNVRPEDFLRWIYPCAALSLVVPAYDYQEIGVLVSAFCFFHICYGIAWPFLARLRSIYIPTEQRAAIMTMFQVPAHAAVVFILIHGSIYQQLENSRVFGMSITGLFVGGYCLHRLNRSRQQVLEKFATERP